MTSGDKLSLSGIAAIVILLSVVLWLLRNGKPHYEWLERLAHRPFSPRQRVAWVIGLSVVMFMVLSAVVRILTQSSG